MKASEYTGTTSPVDLARQTGGHDATWHAHYLSALARRSAQQPAAVRQLLEKKLAALRCASPSASVHIALPARSSPTPDSPLTELTRALKQRSGQSECTGPAAPSAELQVLRQFRKTWTKLSVDRQVAQAMVAAPENAGPLNSHFLALRTLTVLREISPDYLNRFVPYLDTLLCIDHAVNQIKPALKRTTRAKATKR